MKWSDLPFSHQSDRKKEKGMVLFMHDQNIICSQTQLDDIAHEQTITCRQLFAGHVVGSPPMKRKNNLLHMIIIYLTSKQLTPSWFEWFFGFTFSWRFHRYPYFDLVGWKRRSDLYKWPWFYYKWPRGEGESAQLQNTHHYFIEGPVF